MANLELLRKRNEFALAILLLGLVVYCGVIGRRQLLNDADTLWHVAVGREIVTTGFPTVDQYSFTHNGERWLANQWLAECIMAGFDWLGGFDGVLLFAVVIIAATYTYVASCWLARGMDPLLTAAFLAIVLSASSYTFTARPHLFSIPLMGMTYCLLRRVEVGSLPRLSLTWLLPLFVLWANLHGGVLGGLGSLGVVVGLWTVAWLLRFRGPIDSAKMAAQMWLLVAAILATVVVNPYGIGALREWLDILAMSLPDLIIEHAPLDPRSLPGLFTIALALLYTGVFIKTPGGWRSATLWLPLVWFLLSLTRIRHAPLFAIVAAIALADMLPASRAATYLRRHGWLTPSSSTAPPFSRRVAALGISLMVILASGAIWMRHIGPLPLVGRNWTAPPARVWPLGILPALDSFSETAPVGTPVFNEPHLGGMMIYNYPKLRVFIDGRCELYGEPFLRQFVAAWDDPSILGQWQATYGFQTALVAADSPLRKYFESREAWHITSQTNEAILYEQQPAPPAN